MSNVPPGPLGEKRTLRIPWAPSAAPRIRKELVEDLLAREVAPQVIDEAEIVVSELVANAIRHAKPLSDGAIRIHWKVKNNVVEVEVSDGGGPTVPRPAPPTTWAPGAVGCASSAPSPTSGASSRTPTAAPSGPRSEVPPAAAPTEPVGRSGG